MTSARVHTIAFWGGVRTTRLAIRVLGFAKTVAILGALPRFPAQRSADYRHAIRWSETIDSVNGRPYGGTCLDRSVLLWFVMRLHHLDGELRIGVNFDGSKVDGHAWVEMVGRVVNDLPDVANSFAVFDGDPIGVVFR